MNMVGHPVATVDKALLPQRLHHTARVVKDQAATRTFYEDVLGMPLVATWAEVAQLPEFPGSEREYCHTFYALADGGAMAFFQFADDELYDYYKAKTQTVFNHVALMVTPAVQERMRARLEEHGFPAYILDHGYCQSLYTIDPDGLNLEFTSDPQEIDQILAWQGGSAHDSLQRWLSGDRTPNNDLHHR